MTPDSSVVEVRTTLSLEAVRAQLRREISAWSADNPDRIIASIPVNSIEELANARLTEALVAFRELEGYIGAAVDDESVSIPWSYELHPMLVTGVIEVLLRSDGLREQPARRLADETAHFAHKQWLDTRDDFTFTAPVCVIERVEGMSKADREKFRTRFSRRLYAVGLTSSGSVTSTLQIRQDR